MTQLLSPNLKAFLVQNWVLFGINLWQEKNLLGVSANFQAGIKKLYEFFC